MLLITSGVANITSRSNSSHVSGLLNKLWTGIFGFGLANGFLLYRDYVVRADKVDDAKQDSENHYVFLRRFSRQMLKFTESDLS